MSTANKLSYLNDTKSLLRTSLNKFGSSILSTDTFRSYDTKLNEIYDKLPKVTQSGAGFTLSDVQNGLVDDFKMLGVDLQQNTTTGKNLFDKDNEIVGYVYNSSGDLVSAPNWNTNNEFKKISNNKISLSCKTTYPISFLLIEFDSNKTFIQRQQSTTTSYTFTLNNNTEYLRFCYLNNVGTHDIQLEEGSSVTSYEPYTGGIPSPNPDYPQEIKVVEGRQVIADKGKNKFYLNNNYSTNYGEASIEVNNNNSFILRMNKTSSYKQSPCATIEFNANYLKPNTTYTISKKNSNTGYVLNHVGSIRLYTNGSYGDFIDADEYTFTTPNVITSFKILLYLFFDNTTVGNYEITFYDIQLEENSTATDYEPYYEPTNFSIDLNSENLSNGINQNYWLNTAVVTAGVTNNNTGLAIDVRNLGIIIIETSVTQTRYRVACVNSLPQASSQVTVNKGINKDNTSSSITIDTTGYNYLIINATDLSSLNVYYKYELAKIPNTDYKNRIYKNNGNWYFEENVKKYIIDGTESLTTQSAYSGYYRYMFVLMENYKNDNLSYGVVGMNSHFIQRITQPHGDYEYLYLQAANNNLLSVYIQIKNLSTIANFKTWLSENNVVVWYVLANPVTTQITNTTLINQLNAISVHTGTNIIELSSDNNMTPQIEITRLKELERLT